MIGKKLKLVQQDPWLEDSAQDILDRYNRYKGKLAEIINNFQSKVPWFISFILSDKGLPLSEITSTLFAPNSERKFLVASRSNFSSFQEASCRQYTWHWRY